MKGFLTVLVSLLLLVSCKESGVQLAKPSTFIRYFNGGFNDQAQTVIETSDNGFLILANSNTNNTLSNNYFKIKLIKTDAYGNQVWQHFFPEFPTAGQAVNSYQGFGISAIRDDKGNDTGYVIVGEQINGSTRRLLMIKVNKDGDPSTSIVRTFDFGGIDVQGVSVAWAKNTGRYFVLGQNVSVNPAPTESMILAEVKDTTENSVATIDLVQFKKMGDGKSTLANRLFLSYDEKSAFWGGSVVYTNQGSEIRYVNSGFTSLTVGFNLPIGDGFNYHLEGNDLCPYGFGYAFIGGLGAIGDTKYSSINYTQVSSSGQTLASINFDLLRSSVDKTSSPQSIQPANSICSTLDGGLILLGTIALDDQATDTDYYLIKIDAAGNSIPQWTKHFGSKFVDIGARVLQASDGGFIILGTTNLANVTSVCLVKTDSQGNIQ